MREKLPQRRASVHVEFIHHNSLRKAFNYTATLSYYDGANGERGTGRLGEVFLEAAKIGTDLDIAVSDSAVAVSLALQHGCELETLRDAFLKNSEGNAEGVLGTLFELLDADGRPKPGINRSVATD